MTLAYEEIAATRMRRIKDSVLNNRRFLNGLTDVFRTVKHSYEKEISQLVREEQGVFKNRKKKRTSVKSRKKKVVAVLLSSNTGLYGDIVGRTFEEFVQYISSNNVDPVVIGKLGKQAFETKGLETNYKYFDLSDSAQDDENKRGILEYLDQYENIVVFHGKFKDILNQVPTRTYVTGQDLAIKPTERVTTVRCFFEPSLKEVLVFFESQILSALFEQTLYESALSKFTSRMVSLDTASVHITKAIKKANLMKKALKHMEYNKEQSNVLAGISFWRG